MNQAQSNRSKSKKKLKQEPFFKNKDLTAIQQVDLFSQNQDSMQSFRVYHDTDIGIRQYHQCLLVSQKQDHDRQSSKQFIKQQKKKLSRMLKRVKQKNENGSRAASQIKKQSSVSFEQSESKEMDIQYLFSWIAQQKIQEFQQPLQIERNNEDNNSLNQAQKRLQNLQQQHESELRLVNTEIQSKLGQNEKLSQQKMVTEQQLKSLKAHINQQEHRIQVLSQKLREQKASSQLNQEKYLKMLQQIQKKHQEILSSIQREYQYKGVAIEANLKQEKEVQRWKIQYKMLQQKYEFHLKNELKKNQQIKQQCKNCRAFRQQLQLSAHKINLLEKEIQTFVAKLKEQNEELVQKQIKLIQLRQLTQIQVLFETKAKQTAKDECEELQDKLAKLSQKYQLQKKLRKQIQEKIFRGMAQNESLRYIIECSRKGCKEQEQKLQEIKRLSRQNSYYNRRVSEFTGVLDNLRTELGQYIKDASKIYYQNKLESFKEQKNRFCEEYKILEQYNKKLNSEIVQLKHTIHQKQEAINHSKQELNTIIDNCNLNCNQLHQNLQEKDQRLQNFSFQLQETNQIRQTREKIFQFQIAIKNQEINSLRTELAAQKIPNSYNHHSSTTVDTTLKSNIQQNNRLRQQLTKKSEEIFRLRDDLSTLQSQHEHFKAEIQISKLKTMAEKKIMEANYQVLAENAKNELDLKQKKVYCLLDKIDLVIEQNKKKDSFIQTYIVEKILPQNQKDLANAFIKQYEITIGSNDIQRRLSVQNKQMQKLALSNRNLTKEIAVLKEKLRAYEANQEQKASILASRSQPYSFGLREISEELKEDVTFFGTQHKKEKNSKLKKNESLKQFITERARIQRH